MLDRGCLSGGRDRADRCRDQRARPTSEEGGEGERIISRLGSAVQGPGECLWLANVSRLVWWDLAGLECYRASGRVAGRPCC
jgi:hypothetical protein